MKISLVLFAGFCYLAVASGNGPLRISANKTTLEKQKQVLALLYHVQQVLPEHVKIAESFFPFNSHDTPLYLKEDGVKQFHEYWKYARLAKGSIFSIFDQRHFPQAVALFKMFYYAKDYETFYKTAVWARVNVNAGMFVYCFYVAVVHRADTKGIMLPPIYEVTPNLFFGADVFDEVQFYRKVHRAQHDRNESTNGFIIDSNYSNQHSNLDDEQTTLAYYLRDIGVNAFFFNLHINFPFWMNSSEFGWNNIPRGNFYYFFYLNIWARYNLERLSYGYDDIEYFDWDLPVETPYDSDLVYPEGIQFPNRPKFAKLHEYFYNYGENRWARFYTGYSHTYVKDLERRINDAIGSGAIWNETEGELVKLESEEFLNVLGNLIEGNQDSANLHFYGPIWHFARHLLGYSAQQLDQNDVVPSALEHFETTLRDPVFYQLITKIVVLPFQIYLDRIPAYTKDELMFNGVEITKVDIDPLMTYFKPHCSILINSVLHGSHEHENDFNVSVCQQRLNHMPFDITMDIKSDKAQKASIRLFMGPTFDSNGRNISIKDNRLHFFHIDNFVVDLHAGDNVITRKSIDSHFFSPDKESFRDLWHDTVKALEDDQAFTTDLRQNWFGFPKRFMIPKGSPSGTPYQFFFAIHPYKEHHIPLTHNLDVLQVDNYPLGFPLDRHIYFDKMWEHIPNFHFEEVKVFLKIR
ncbi:hypothetical protein JTB14_010215 [Gonioctena quinquepunctata]|nr:hypothetical protein JTB14_010215 [Gonioctena quinquepunctata]